MRFALKYWCVLIILLVAKRISAQNPQINNKGIRVMFYNVENLFHPENDSLKRDDEFTPEGLKRWNYYRYTSKLNKIAQNIIAIGEWQPPAVVGLCEIENKQCLNDLIYNTPLKQFGYQIIHQESKDPRGIDVALLYRPDFFKPEYFRSIELEFPDGNSTSRDILYVKGVTGKDTLHCFVNHWPSRYGGQLETEPKRAFAARILKSHIDSTLNTNKNANIIAMGDFNDYPTDNSLSKILNAQKDTFGSNSLINLCWQFEGHSGTNKYQQYWHVLDQFIVNKNLMDNRKGLYTSFHLTKIFTPKWLLIDESNSPGQKPFRTYNGFNYINGYSDHLPIYIDILYAK